MKHSFYCISIGLVSTVLLSACQSSHLLKPPSYQKPFIENDESYKYAALNWVKISEITADSQEWWKIYNDDQLDVLMQQVKLQNLTLRQAEARYRFAMAQLDQQIAQGAVAVDMSTTAGRNGSKEKSSSSYFSAGVKTSWIPDLWGRVSKAVEGQQANLDASSADLAAITLNQQLLAADAYWMIRALDLKLHVLQQTQKSYQRSVQILKHQYNAGMIARADVIQAETQLKKVTLQQLNLGRDRILNEHILAILVGKTAANFQLNQSNYHFKTIDIPYQIPSKMLNKRPDIIRTERQLAATHAQLGLAQTAWLPDLNIGLDASLNSQVFSSLIQSPNYLWSVGGQALGTLFDGGKRQAEIDKAQANYDEKLMVYKQTVLNAFKEVEDALLQSHSFKQQIIQQRQLLDLAKENERVVNQRYQAGLVSYLEVSTAQNLRLQSEQDVLELEHIQMKNSMQLVAALGVNWSSPVD